jgi:hypothetical protein
MRDINFDHEFGRGICAQRNPVFAQDALRLSHIDALVRFRPLAPGLILVGRRAASFQLYFALFTEDLKEAGDESFERFVQLGGGHDFQSALSIGQP